MNLSATAKTVTTLLYYQLKPFAVKNQKKNKPGFYICQKQNLIVKGRTHQNQKSLLRLGIIIYKLFTSIVRDSP